MIVARELTAGTANAALTLTPAIYEIKLLANDSVNTLTVSLEGSTASATNLIILKAGEKLENLQTGNVEAINYIASAASSKFRIVATAR